MKRLFQKTYLLAMALLGILMLASCASHPGSGRHVLKHVVAFQFNDDVSEERKNQAVQDFRDLSGKIPEIRKFEGGENVSDKGMNKQFTHWFVLTFDSEADRDIYLPHPAHLEVVQKNKPLLADLLVVDFWGLE